MNSDIVIYGISRCGNHIVIYWILENLGKSGIFYNDVSLEFDVNKPDANLPEVKKARYNGVYSSDVKPINIYSYENKPINTQHNERILSIFRDPYNWVASLLQHNEVRPKHKKWPINWIIEHYIQNFKTICRESLAWINYSTWVISPKY
ncbi:hypothetical protein LCGC14_1408050, partial [marine sediment metagenome]